MLKITWMIHALIGSLLGPLAPVPDAARDIVLSEVVDQTLVAQADGTPIRAGTTVTGQLAPGDSTLSSGEYVDYYVFDGQAGEVVEIRMTSTDFDSYLLLRGPQGFSEDNDDEAPGILNSLIEVRLPSTGTYTIGATSYAPGETGTYQLSFATTPSGATAGPAVLSTSSPIMGQLGTGSDRTPQGNFVDTHSMNAQSGEDVRIILRSPDFDTVLRVQGPGGFSQENDDAPGMGTNSRLDFQAPATGTYTIQVTSFRPGEVGAYALERVSAAATQPSATAPSITAGTPVQRALSTSDAQLQTGEYYQPFIYNGTAGERITIRLDSSDFDTYLMLRGAGGVQIDNDDRAQGDLNSEIVTTLPETGAYRVIVTSYAPGEVGNYILALTSGGSVVPVSAPLVPGAPVTGQLTDQLPVRPGGQHVATYTFEGTQGARAVIDLSSDVFDTYLTLVSPNGLVEINDDIDQSNLNSRITMILPTSGTYRVEASSYAAGATGPFRLLLTVDQADHTIAAAGTDQIAFDTPISGRLEPGDEALATGELVDAYTFQGEAGQSITISMESNEIDTYLMLRGPDGFAIDNDDAPGMGTNSAIEATLPASGIYVVSATSYAPREVGAYRLEMTRGTTLQRDARGRVFAVLAGITDYAGASSNLPYCAEDATKLHESLAGTGLLDPRSVVLTDGEVTRARLRQAFSDVAQHVGPDDIFIFFYSGHGSQLANSAELNGYDETLYVIDGHITDDEVASWFDQVNDARVAIVALDSCFSGGFARDVITYPNRMGIFSSEEDVLSNVAGRFQAGGYLSYFLRSAFEGDADTDPRDGVLTAGELAQYLRTQWAHHMTQERTYTGEMANTYQNLVVDRGGVKVTDVILYTPINR